MSDTLSDSKTGEAFELVLSNTDNALDVFHHPYAYAASRRPDFGVRTSENHALTRPRSVRPLASGAG